MSVKWVVTPKEMRASTTSSPLYNEQMSSTGDKAIKEKPPLFFVGTNKLNGNFGGDQAVICLPLWPLLKYAIDAENRRAHQIV
jgi:hypothetical protein